MNYITIERNDIMESIGRWVWKILKRNVCRNFIEIEKIQERFTTYKVQKFKHKF
jgi:hypothetical protein